MFGREVNIERKILGNVGTNGRDELGRQGQVRKEINKYFGDQQDRVRDDSESKRGFRTNVEIDVKLDKSNSSFWHLYEWYWRKNLCTE